MIFREHENHVEVVTIQSYHFDGALFEMKVGRLMVDGAAKNEAKIHVQGLQRSIFNLST